MREGQGIARLARVLDPACAQRPAWTRWHSPSVTEAILDFERSWWTEAGPKDTAIRERFELSGTRYYQLLTELLDDPDGPRLRPAAHPAAAPRARAPPPRPRRGAPDEPARRAIGETRTMARRRPAEPTANPARGAALVVVAVVIGLFLLRNGLDTSEAVTTNGGSDSATSDGSPTDGDATDEGTGRHDHHHASPAPAARRGAHDRAQRLGDPGRRGHLQRRRSRRSATSSPTPTAPTPTPKATQRDDGRSTSRRASRREAAAVATAIGAPDTVVPPRCPPRRPARSRAPAWWW